MDELTRTVDELVTRYSVAPELSGLDLFLEGAFDVDLFRAFFRDSGISNVVPYEIVTVDVPEELLAKVGLTSGNRQKVIALAAELSLHIKRLDCVLFVADLDEEQFLGTVHRFDHLAYTDDTALELYVIDSNTVERTAQDFAGAYGYSGSEIMSILLPHCQRLFRARVAAKALGWKMDWIDISKSKYVSVSKCDLVFDHSKYLGNNLNSNGYGSSLEVLEAKMAEFEAIAETLAGNCFRGHDFVTLLCTFLRKNGRLKASEVSDESVLRTLLATKEIRALHNEQLFLTLHNLSARRLD
jgi:hypothetical protein